MLPLTVQLSTTCPSPAAPPRVIPEVIAEELAELVNELRVALLAELLEVPGILSLGFSPTKCRSALGGVAIPAPRKKLGCGGWL